MDPVSKKYSLSFMYSAKNKMEKLLKGKTGFLDDQYIIGVHECIEILQERINSFKYSM